MSIAPRRLLADTTPLRVSPAFRRLWWGLGVSNLGAQLTAVAVGLQVYALSHSSLAVGVLGMAGLVPLIALGLYGGALVDAFDRRKVALASGIAMWATTGLIALQAWVHLDSLGALYALIAVQAAAVAINNPARSAIIPRLIAPPLLPAANALQTIAWNIALSVGPLGGAVLVALWGYQFAYTVDAALFTAALWAIWRLPDIPPAAESNPVHADQAMAATTDLELSELSESVVVEFGESPGGSPAKSPVPVSGSAPDAAAPDARLPRRMVGLSSVLDGLRYLATRPNVRTTFLVDLAAMILAFPRVLFPAVGVLYLGGQATTTGLLSAAFAVGAVLAGLFSGGLARVRWQGRVIVGAVTGWGLSVSLFGLVLLVVGAHSPGSVLIGATVAACAVLAAAGASDAVSAVFRQTILQTATPDDMRGRLQGVFTVVVAGGPRLGDLVLGSEASWFGEAQAAVIGGLACVAVLLVIVRLQPRFWHYDARDPQP